VTTPEPGAPHPLLMLIEAMRSSKEDQWKKATDEYTAIVNKNTYRLVSLPKDRNSVTTKWI